MSDTYERFVNLLANGFGIAQDEVTPESTFEEMDLDSLALVELTLAAQDEFEITLSDDDLQATFTLAETVKVLESKLVTL